MKTKGKRNYNPFSATSSSPVVREMFSKFKLGLRNLIQVLSTRDAKTGTDRGVQCRF